MGGLSSPFFLFRETCSLHNCTHYFSLVKKVHRCLKLKKIYIDCRLSSITTFIIFIFSKSVVYLNISYFVIYFIMGTWPLSHLPSACSSSNLFRVSHYMVVNKKEGGVASITLCMFCEGMADRSGETYD